VHGVCAPGRSRHGGEVTHYADGKRVAAGDVAMTLPMVWNRKLALKRVKVRRVVRMQRELVAGACNVRRAIFYFPDGAREAA